MLASLPSSFPFIAIPGGRARLIELKLSSILFLQQKQQQKVSALIFVMLIKFQICVLNHHY